MRHLVYLLLVANLIYLGWNLFPGQSVGEPINVLPPVPEGAKSLVTLKEMQQGAAATPEPADAGGSGERCMGMGCLCSFGLGKNALGAGALATRRDQRVDDGGTGRDVGPRDGSGGHVRATRKPALRDHERPVARDGVGAR